jgi:hypothetical protein
LREHEKQHILELEKKDRLTQIEEEGIKMKDNRRAVLADLRK